MSAHRHPSDLPVLPFCDGWERWCPDPDWPLPDLPPTLTPDLP
jgi:hypothetical protein